MTIMTMAMLMVFVIITMTMVIMMKMVYEDDDAINNVDNYDDAIGDRDENYGAEDLF